MIIELAVPEERNQLENLLSAVFDYLETHHNYPKWCRAVYPTMEDIDKAIAAHTLYIAKKEETVVGCIVINHHVESQYAEGKWILDCLIQEQYIIHTFMVHPVFYGKKIGQCLLQFAERKRISDGMHSLRLDVYTENIPAIHLYEALGFMRTGRVDLGWSDYGLDYFYLYEKPLLHTSAEKNETY